MKFTCKKFEKLSVYELYDIMALRAEVFVVEQNCPYQDADGKDLDGWHLLGHNTEGGPRGLYAFIAERRFV